MGIFSKKKAPAENLSIEQKNEKKLKSFKTTKAWGIKKYPDAMQFIYDEDKKQFVVVEGPAETFKERNPWVITFAEVNDSYMEIECYWTKNADQGIEEKGTEILPKESYGKVYWHYNFYYHIMTRHEAVGDFKFKMNYNETVIRVPSHDGKYRGLGLAGLVRGKGYTVNIDRLTEMVQKIEADGSPEEKANVGKINTVIDHLKRARRIQKLLR